MKKYVFKGKAWDKNKRPLKKSEKYSYIVVAVDGVVSVEEIKSSILFTKMALIEDERPLVIVSDKNRSVEEAAKQLKVPLIQIEPDWENPNAGQQAIEERLRFADGVVILGKGKVAQRTREKAREKLITTYIKESVDVEPKASKLKV